MINCVEILPIDHISVYGTCAAQQQKDKLCCMRMICFSNGTRKRKINSKSFSIYAHAVIETKLSLLVKVSRAANKETVSLLGHI